VHFNLVIPCMPRIGSMCYILLRVWEHLLQPWVLLHAARQQILVHDATLTSAATLSTLTCSSARVPLHVLICLWPRPHAHSHACRSRPRHTAHVRRQAKSRRAGKGHPPARQGHTCACALLLCRRLCSLARWLALTM
jgi:hypothetical protein